MSVKVKEQLSKTDYFSKNEETPKRQTSSRSALMAKSSPSTADKKDINRNT